MKYDAFISYRHSELDLHIAKKIHKGLETLKVPKAVGKKTGKKKIKRVFRDQEELPIGSDLGGNIEGALKESEFLIVICSPRTPESYWVQKEISTFIEMHDREHVLAVLVEGEPNESFPEQLLIDDNGKPVEPLAADVRGKSKKEIDKKLKTEILRLAAPLLHCTYDDLKQRHKERQMRRIAAVTGMVAVLGVAFGIYSTYNAALIQQNYEGKQRNQSKYLADTSLRLLEEGDRRAAALVALEALPSEKNDKPYVAEAQYALSEALYCYDAGNDMKMDRILQHELPVSDFSYNEEGTRVVSLDQGGTIYVWDIENGEKLAQIAPRIDENGYLAETKGIMLYEDHIIVCEYRALRSFGLDGQEEWTVSRPELNMYCRFDASTLTVACVSSDEVAFFDVTTGKKITTLPNQQESSYTRCMAFNDNKTKFAISHLTEDGEDGCVTIFDLKTKKITDIKVKAAYITEIAFSTDDGLVVTQIDSSDILDLGFSVGNGYISKYDWVNNTLLWEDSYTYQVLGYENASSQVKCRKLEDVEEVIMSVDNVVYSWDGATGERLMEVVVDDGIENLLVATTSSFVYLAQSNGTVDIVNLETGMKYSDSAIETGKEIQALALKNGVIVLRSYASPNLTVMKYPSEADIAEPVSFDKSIYSVYGSKDETYYAVDLYDYSYGSHVCFFETEGNQPVYEWIEETDSSLMVSGFVDDKVYMTGYLNGTMMFYDVKSGKKETLTLGDDFWSVEYDLNKDNTMALAYGATKYALIDLRKQKVLVTGEIEGYLYGAILSDDGKWACCNIKDAGVLILNIAKRKFTKIEQPEYKVLSSIENQDAFAFSEDGKLVAVSCSDGQLRVYDIEKMETVEEIPFVGVNRRFIEFTDDDTKIMMQGDDYYFRVYDLKKDEFSYIATDQYYEIKEVITDEETSAITVITLADMAILNADDFERIAMVDGGKRYLPKQGIVLSADYKTMYQFPYMTLEMLQEEAKEQFGGDTLTELERIKFHVE